MTPFKVVIPARYASTRLPGKPLLEIDGKPLIRHVYERAQMGGAEQIVVATDDRRIADCAAGFGAATCLTAREHASGSDRIAEAVRHLDWPDEALVVNLQGDEPLMPVANLRQVAENLAHHPEADIATLCALLTDADEARNPNVVKVVFDTRGRALYFSRAPIPWGQASDPDTPARYRHIGLYAYRTGYLKRFAELETSPLETAERLEQLRALWHGACIHVATAAVAPGPGVDTPADLERVRELLRS